MSNEGNDACIPRRNHSMCQCRAVYFFYFFFIEEWCVAITPHSAQQKYRIVNSVKYNTLHSTKWYIVWDVFIVIILVRFADRILMLWRIFCWKKSKVLDFSLAYIHSVVTLKCSSFCQSYERERYPKMWTFMHRIIFWVLVVVQMEFTLRKNGHGCVFIRVPCSIVLAFALSLWNGKTFCSLQFMRT